MQPQDILKKYFGYDAFRPRQEEIIRHVLAGKDALVLMPTGGGKSLCYQVPALMFDGLTLVISPLISLMKDQVDALKAAGIPAAFINSTLDRAQIAKIEDDARTGKIVILYIAPERIAAPGAGHFLADLKVSLIAVDEAHCISEWGHDFRPDYRNLRVLRNLYPKAPVLALTATATQPVAADIMRQLSLKDAGPFVSSFNRPNLTYIVRPKKQAFDGLVDLLKNHREEAVIIYCFSRKDTEKLADDLVGARFRAAAYHAGLDQKDRARTQDRFIRDDLHIIVATIAFGMGINKPDVRLVVHYDLPKSVEGYYQETGRAGRDGLPAECVLFFTYADMRKHQFFLDRMEPGPERDNVSRKLEQVLRYGQNAICRRRQLLSYFGEPMAAGSCDACDVCVPQIVQQAAEAKPKVGSLLMPTHDLERFQKLRVVRKRIADAERIPAFMIFGDKSLKDMAAKRPKDKAGFSRVFGVGQAKLEAFSDVFLDVIREHAEG